MSQDDMFDQDGLDRAKERRLPPPPKKKGPARDETRTAKEAGGKKRKHYVVRRDGVRHEFSAGFLVFRDTEDGRRWLVLDYGKHWDYPKGHLEEGESAWRAAVRELREETGIRQVDRMGKFERSMEYWFSSPKKGRVHKTVTFFVGKTRTANVTLSDEHSGYAWLRYDDALERLTFENAKEMLRAAEEAVGGSQAT